MCQLPEDSHCASRFHTLLGAASAGATPRLRVAASAAMGTMRFREECISHTNCRGWTRSICPNPGAAAGWALESSTVTFLKRLAAPLLLSPLALLAMASPAQAVDP